MANDGMRRDKRGATPKDSRQFKNTKSHVAFNCTSILAIYIVTIIDVVAPRLFGLILTLNLVCVCVCAAGLNGRCCWS